MRDIAIEEREEIAGCVAFPGRGCTGKIEGLHAARAKCPGRYALEKVVLAKRDRFLFTIESVTEGHPDKIAEVVVDGPGPARADASRLHGKW
jgi:hypothetical protein